mgnify:FL=1
MNIDHVALGEVSASVFGDRKQPLFNLNLWPSTLTTTSWISILCLNAFLTWLFLVLFRFIFQIDDDDDDDDFIIEYYYYDDVVVVVVVVVVVCHFCS